jgi:hypothetical protein
MNADKIAKKYAGKVVKCKIAKSLFKPIGITADQKEFYGKVVGYKLTDQLLIPKYVLVEPEPPLRGFFNGTGLSKNTHIWTYKPVPLYVHKIYATDVLLDKETDKNISSYPHICKDCHSPAWISMNLIDCSNPNCKNKYSSKSAQDLFLPAEMRSRKAASEITKLMDDKDFIVCDKCGDMARYLGAINSKDGKEFFFCKKGHSWRHTPIVGQKVMSSSGKRVYTYDGKRFA